VTDGGKHGGKGISPGNPLQRVEKDFSSGLPPGRKTWLRGHKRGGCKAGGIVRPCKREKGDQTNQRRVKKVLTLFSPFRGKEQERKREISLNERGL